jgi:hypothetical protein
MDGSLLRRQLARQLWIPLICLGGVALVLDGQRDTFDPLGREYGANWPGDLPGALAQLAVEGVILYAILRPHSYHHSWKRCLAALAVLLPWTFVDMFVIAHTGRIWHGVWLWNVLLLPLLFLAAIVSLMTEHTARFRASGT